MLKFNLLVAVFCSLGVFALPNIETDGRTIQKENSRDGITGLIMSGSDGISHLSMGRDGSYFYVQDLGKDLPQKVMYRKAFDAEEQLLFDLGDYENEKGVNYTVRRITPDHEAQRLALAIAPADSEIAELLVIDLEGKIIDVPLKNASGIMSWMPDANYIIYHQWSSAEAKEDKYRKDSRTMIHQIGTPQKKDVEYFSAELHPELKIDENELALAYFDRELKVVIGVVPMEDGRLKMYIKRGNLLEPSRWEILAKPTDYVAGFFVSKKQVYYKVFQDVPNYRIVGSVFRWPDVCNGDLVVEEFDDAKIGGFVANADGLYFTTMHEDGESKLWFKPKREDLYQPVALPSSATAIELMTNDPLSGNIWVTITDNNLEEVRYRYLRKSGEFLKNDINKPVVPTGMEE